VIIVRKVKEMQRRASDWRKAGKTISFVPTMGFLHEGHISLMRGGRERADVLVVSIFVNPTQFAPNEDLDRYPCDFEGDEKKCRTNGVDAIYYPPVEEMYPIGYQTYVNVKEVSQGLCGASRPTHFQGVATVCLKLFNAVKPHYAIFGQKDYQQLQVIRRMVKDLDMDMEIIGMPTVREPDGLAMSSRNKYLSREERERAIALSASLRTAKNTFKKGERDPDEIAGIVKKALKKAEPCEIDYVEVRDAEDLTPVKRIGKGPVVVALAVKIGATRLIDNMVLRP
jgi:pantoate--beta-alanine ligase